MVQCTKGFGFIAPDDDDEDLFVRQTSIQSDGFRTLFDGQPVEFSVDSGEDGRTKAYDVVGVSRSCRLLVASAEEVAGEGTMEEEGVGFRRGGRLSGGGYGGAGGGGACFNYRQFGHLARDCYQSSSSGGRYGGGDGGGCYNCGEEGHFARDCPNTDNK